MERVNVERVNMERAGMEEGASKRRRQWPFYRGTGGQALPGEFARGRIVLRWVALGYSFYFFVEPYHRHSAKVWGVFAAFYVAFLALYFSVLTLQGRLREIAFGLFFLLGFLYYPYNESACGTLVFAFVMLAFFVQQLRTLFLVLLATMAGLLLESWMVGYTLRNAETVLFFCVIVGMSNFAYSQQVSANARLTAANAEIERLSQEAERERIARDLHDLLGHTLTVITMKLDLARRLLPGDPDHARTEIVEAEQTARDALLEVREAVVGYRADGLTSEIARARRSLRSANVALTTTIEPVDLSSTQGNVLCLALREAVTNIVRHARASACHIAVTASAFSLEVTIEDDGCGVGGGEGNGLRGMRERLESIGGSMRVAAAVTGGTKLRLTLPVGAAIGSKPTQMRETATA